ncbi:MAG: UPF0182 family protein, partial [Firmicutes bacterium]|nr:UPF0182 family protein [Bacillota bacterium]
MKKILWLVLALIVLISVFLLSANLIADYLWFKELGYVSVFFTQLVAQVKIGVPLFAGMLLLCCMYLRILRRKYYNAVPLYGDDKDKMIRWSGWLISGVFSLVVSAKVISNMWFQMLQFFNSTDFGIADPIFGKDVSFYIFKLDLLTRLNENLLSIVFLFAVAVVAYYLIMIALRPPRFFERTYEDAYTYEEPQQSNNPFGQMFGQHNRSRVHKSLDKEGVARLISLTKVPLMIMGILVFLMVGFHFYLLQFRMLYSGVSDTVFGASFTDINISLWVYRVLMALSLLGAVAVVFAFNRKRWKYVAAVPVLMIAVMFGGSLIAGGVQSFVVSPDELNKEAPYINNNIEFTRYAYDLQDITVQEYAADTKLTIDDIADNVGTLSNIRINDFEPVAKFYNQTQSIRSYYHFLDVDVDRYMVNGDYTQVFLSAREIDSSATGDQWLSSHLKYTHGYGITLSRVDTVTESGQPDMLIDSIPPVSEVAEIMITRPEIYYGEAASDYVIVNTAEQEFDYPSGDSNVYTTYQGEGGIPLNLLNRALFAVIEGDTQILVSTNINSNSKILINRNVLDRVQKLAPFLYYDGDPYIVVDGGELYWMIDAYTVSDNYPYSEPYISSSGMINYIRNSVKVVVDAYDGDVSYYIVDEEDPLALTLQKIYPALFKNYSEMPDGLKAHIRYPDAMFSIQADVFSKYHMTDAGVFYHNEDRWALATEVYGSTTSTMQPHYYIMKLPGEAEAEFISSVPYTPNGKSNMTALLVARSDGEAYGELVLYQFPKDRLIYGPQQVEAQINQHTEIAQDFTLWSSAGSTYTRGNLFVIPIDGALMYVEPIYLESASSSMPEVKRVIVYYNEKIAYADTLADALDEMFGSGAGDILGGGTTGEPDSTPDTDVDTTDMAELAAAANRAYDNARAAQKNGDWAGYGKYLEELQ